jgi:hypothetical protein
LVGCGTKNIEVTEPEMTGEIQEVEMTGEVVEMTGEELLLEITEEEMENFDATEVTKVEGSDEVENDEDVTKVQEDFQKIIDKSNSKTKDDTKLNEDDIDFMEEAIEFI